MSKKEQFPGKAEELEDEKVLIQPVSEEEIVDEEEIDETEDDDDDETIIGESDDVVTSIVVEALSKREEFDWDQYESGKKSQDVIAKIAKYTEIYDKTLSTINENEVVAGYVVAITKREVVVNIGYKSDSIVSINEFRYNPDLKVGDEVEVYVESQEDKNGQLVLSHRRARAQKSWERVNKALEFD